MDLRLSLLPNSGTMVANSDFISHLGISELLTPGLRLKKPRPYFLRLDSTGENMDHISSPNGYNNCNFLPYNMHEKPNVTNTSAMMNILSGFIGSKSCRQEYSLGIQPSYGTNSGSWGFSSYEESNGEHRMSDIINRFSSMILEKEKCVVNNSARVDGLKQKFMNQNFLNDIHEPSKPLNNISDLSGCLSSLSLLENKCNSFLNSISLEEQGLINDYDKASLEITNDNSENIVNKNSDTLQVELCSKSENLPISCLVDLPIPDDLTEVLPISEPVNLSISDSEKLHLEISSCENEKNDSNIERCGDDINLIKDLFLEDLTRPRKKIFRKKRKECTLDVLNVTTSSLNLKIDAGIRIEKDILTNITNKCDHDRTVSENLVSQNEQLSRPNTSNNFCINFATNKKLRKKQRKKQKRLKCKSLETSEIIHSNQDILEKIDCTLTQKKQTSSTSKELWDEQVSDCKKSRLERPVCQNPIVKFILGCDSDFSEGEDQNPELAELNSEDPWDELDSVFVWNNQKVEENESILQSSIVKPKKQVHFAEGDNFAVVHMILSWDRKGPWEEYGLDRFRFERRIQDVGKAISYCFEPAHRSKIYQNYYQE